MNLGEAILIVVVVGVMTYSMRAVAIVALADRTLPSWAVVVLRSVGPAVLAALAINLAVGGEGDAGIDLAQALALVVTAAIAWWRRNLLQTLVAAMVTLWVATWLL